MIKPKRNFHKDITRIKSISEKIEKKLAKINPSYEQKIDGLTLEELQDLNKIVGLADFMLYKYEDKKETREILEDFVDMIKNAAEHIEETDDELSELIVSAEDSIGKIKHLHSSISEKYDFDRHVSTDTKLSSNNLTKITTEINTVGYQQTSQD